MPSEEASTDPATERTLLPEPAADEVEDTAAPELPSKGEASAEGRTTPGSAQRPPGAADGSEPGGSAPGWRPIIAAGPLDLSEPAEELPGGIVPLEEARARVRAPQAPEDDTGQRPGEGYTLCLRCFGGGQIVGPSPCPVCRGAQVDWCEGICLPCPACGATGRVNVPCPQCGGTGWVRKEAQQLNKDEPAGSDSEAAAGPASVGPADPSTG
ncbi:MAG: hypothetical protein H0Z37_03445 [Firmicutes bacterium]|nr:hypothetical protein [Bacillota bacterium]